MGTFNFENKKKSGGWWITVTPSSWLEIYEHVSSCEQAYYHSAKINVSMRVS